MPRKSTQEQQEEPVSISSDGQRWYTAGAGAKKMSKTSGRKVLPGYLSKLGALGKIRTLKVHDRLTLYSQEDVDAYKVEPRGAKSGQAKRKGKTGPTVREQRQAAKQQQFA